MAEIDLNPIFQGVRNRVGKMVFYRRNGETCMRTLGVAKKSNTPAQQAVRSTFARLVGAWKGLAGIAQAGWDSLGRERRMSGYNAFLAENFSRQRQGAALDLVRQSGDLAPVTLTAVPGASGAISCQFSPAPLSGDRHLVLFYRRIAVDEPDDPLARVDCGPNASSPVSITGLEPGAMYSVYAVVTDRAYAEATAVSASSGVIVSAGR